MKLNLLLTDPKKMAGITVAGLVFAIGSLNAQPYFKAGQDPKPVGQNWSAVANMSDEFENTTTLDATKWFADPATNGWTWIGRAPGLFTPNAVTVANGSLRITVKKYTTPQVVNGKTYLYEGGIVRSKNAGQPGWYYECYMRANKTEMSSTFWLMTNNTDCNKKHEIDIQECIGKTTPNTASWAMGWDQIFHSNAIHRESSCRPTATQIQGQKTLTEKNNSRFFVYGAWWKSPTEIQFFLDGTYAYSITPSTNFDMQAYIQLAVETYDWNPVPSDGGMVASGTWAERTTTYLWIRTWKLIAAKSAQITDQNNSSLDLSAYPGNTGRNNIIMNLCTDELSDVNISVFNLSGQNLFNKHLSKVNAGPHQFDIDLNEAKQPIKGLVILQAKTNKSAQSIKLSL